ncbi:unnamed protein product [Adineta steineri]|uniref:NAD(P)(+)--arginine ADP-ribosyltransferase n=1 Tax=Adineta steineri TaxID=433720 RepID=A0A815PM41_9BILA|nr:unnamed protein product [Adineta steineri]CAF4068523.1 unnamed protein product [Adineta steineri]
MSGSESNSKASLSLNTIISPSNAIQPRRRMVRNYSLLCLDECMDEVSQEYQHILAQLKTNTDNVNIFKQRDECVDFLTDAEENVKSFLIVENATVQQIMPLINDISQLHTVYIFSNIKSQHEEWITKWQKVRRVHTNIDDLCQALKIGVRQFNQDSIAMSFITVDEMASTDNLNQLEPTFMYTQLFKEILLDMKHDEQEIKQFISYCRHNDCGSSKNIDEFEKKYQSQSAIWWYTYPSFIYSMLNRALRSMEGDIIINMGFFIHDLHQQIQQLHQQQLSSYQDKPFIVYRGQGLTKSDFEILQKTKGGLMSFNSFLSTSTDKELSLGFSQVALTEPNNVGILFTICINPCIKSAPFATIKEQSYFKEEEEILFSMHTVFRVGVIEQMDNKNQLYQVELQLTSDDDQQLRVLTNRMREEADGDTGWQRLGKLLLKIGQFNKAEELYNVLLDQTSDEGEKAIYHHQLGSVHSDQGDYEKAIWYYEQGLEIQQKTLPSNHPKLATSYNNIGLVYNNIGEYSKALPYHRKALKIREKFLPANHPKLAMSHNNIGLVYANMGEYSKALSSHEKALEIYQKTLPPNHPSLAISYNNIGLMFNSMGDYSKALSSHEKALEIQLKTLPSNHPHLACSYNNIGSVYDNIGEYSKALSYYEKAFEIQEKSLSSDHPDLAVSYGSIGLVYCRMEKYLKALSFYEKALEIQEKTLPSNHRHLATSYNNIGSVCRSMGDYSKALSYYEKALGIHQKTLSSDHPSLATSYNNIGNVYYNMEKYSKALSFYEKSIKIKQKALPSDHPGLAISYNNIACLYYDMTDYSKALSYSERALDIWQRALPPTHPDVKTVKDNIEIIKEDIIKNS